MEDHANDIKTFFNNVRKYARATCLNAITYQWVEHYTDVSELLMLRDAEAFVAQQQAQPSGEARQSVMKDLPDPSIAKRTGQVSSDFTPGGWPRRKEEPLTVNGETFENVEAFEEDYFKAEKEYMPEDDNGYETDASDYADFLEEETLGKPQVPASPAEQSDGLTPQGDVPPAQHTGRSEFLGQ